MSLDTLRGIAEILGLVAFLIINAYQAQKALTSHENVIGVLIDALKKADSSPATLEAIKGATNNVPPEFFDRIVSVLSTTKMFVPDELKTLTDTLSKFFRDVEPDRSPASPPVAIDTSQPV